MVKAKAKAKPKGKPKKPHQKPLFKNNYIREVDTAAEYHEELKAEHNAAGVMKLAAATALNDVMHKHKLTTYETPGGIVCVINEKSQVSTKQKKKKKDKKGTGE